MQAMLAVHFLRNATVTVLLSQRRVSPASETKLGKAPKNVEYVGEREHCSTGYLAVTSCSALPSRKARLLWTLRRARVK